MSDNKNNELEDIYQEDYAKAMEKLNSSKSSRVKQITDAKKAEKKKANKAKAEAKAKEAGDSFLGRCKADPVIPVCIIAAVLVLVGAFLYFLLPNILVNSLKRDMNEFKAEYQTTGIYTQLMSNFGFQITDPVYQPATPESDDKLDYFTCSLAGNSSINVAIQGSSLKSNGELTALRILMEPSGADGFANTIKMVYGSFLQVFYPSMTIEQATAEVSNCMNAVNGTEPTEFTVNGEFAYRFLIATEGESYVFIFDIIPAKNI